MGKKTISENTKSEKISSTKTKNIIKHGKNKKNSVARVIGKTLLGLVLIFTLSTTSIGAYAWYSINNSINTVELATPKNNSSDSNSATNKKQTIEGAFNFLLVGSDSREGSNIDDGATGTLNDVNMLLMVDETHQNATVISIPRDLIVPVPECTDPETGRKKSAMSASMINSTLAHGGLACVASTVTNLTDVPVDYAALVDFAGVISLSEAIGGVTVTLEEDMDDPYTGLNLKAGEVTLVGEDALAFLRSRHGTSDGSDLSRIQNQQLFMEALLDKLTSESTLTDPKKLYKIAKVATDSMTFSSNLDSINDLVSLGLTLSEIPTENIVFVTYPSSSHPQQPGRLRPLTYLSEPMFEQILAGGKVYPNGVPIPGTGPEPEIAKDPATGWYVDEITGLAINPETGIPDTKPQYPLIEPPTTVPPISEEPTNGTTDSETENTAND